MCGIPIYSELPCDFDVSLVLRIVVFGSRHEPAIQSLTGILNVSSESVKFVQKCKSLEMLKNLNCALKFS
jgi:hypothetical protein